MSSQPIKGAYYPSSSRNITPAAIDTQYFTHIYYAFLNPKAGSFQIIISQDENDRILNFNNTLHAKSPSVKTLFAVGGASAGSAVLAPMASNAQSRAAFILSTIQVARRYGFDGVDLDWEFPEDQTHMNNLGSLLLEWRLAVEKEARTTERAPLLLTAAVYFAATIDWGTPLQFPVTSMRDNLDFINVMTYDYYGKFADTAIIGAQAALYGPSPLPDRNTDYGLRSWTLAGVLPSKLVMGMPLFGRKWKLEDPQVSGIVAPAVCDGVLSYAEVVAFNHKNNALVVHDVPTVSVYSVAGTKLISYDDPWSVSQKVEYAKSFELGGYFFWAVDGDCQWELSRTASNLWPSKE